MLFPRLLGKVLICVSWGGGALARTAKVWLLSLASCYLVTCVEDEVTSPPSTSRLHWNFEPLLLRMAACLEAGENEIAFSAAFSSIA